MAVERVVLHVGMSKAGSTAIQQSLWWNAGWLRDRGCHVLRTSTVDMHAIHTDLFNKSADTDADSLTIEAELAGLDDRSWTVVLSTELVWFLDDDGLTQASERLRRWFGDVPVHIVAYVRNQSDWLQSALFQELRAGHRRPSSLLDLHRSLPDISADQVVFLGQRPNITYPDRLAHLANALQPQRITTRLYERNRLAYGDAALDFVSMIGFEPDAQFRPCPEGVNRSFCLEAMAVLADIDDRAVPYDERLGVMKESGLTYAAGYRWAVSLWKKGDSARIDALPVALLEGLPVALQEAQ